MLADIDNTVARVCIDSPLPHLDRPFDYSIPDKFRARIAVGSRVRVRFAGRLVNAVVIAVAPCSEFAGTLSPVNSVAGMPSFTPQSIDTARAIARRYGGALWDVLRLMAPPRVASVEKRDWSGTPDVNEALARALEEIEAPPVAEGWPKWTGPEPSRVVWEALPDPLQPRTVATHGLLRPSLEVAATGTTAIIVLPDARAVAALEQVLASVGLARWTARSAGHYAVLDHDHGPSQRYGSYLAAMHGHVRLVIGTRPAVLQPVPHLGLISVWDEGNGTYEDPHAPYPHARTVAAMRSELDNCGLLLAAYSPSVDAAALVEHGWARLMASTRADVRAHTPAVTVLTGERRDAEGASGWHWMPASVWKSLTGALVKGPVAVVVPRAGYVQAVACARCKAWAQCRHCEGSLKLPAPGADLVCVECARPQPQWHCPHCQSRSVTQVRQGIDRIAEQLCLMLKDTEVHVSSAAAGTIDDLAVQSGLVVATPGALPAVHGGYAHVAVVGGNVPATGGLGADALALRWWFTIAALARPVTDGGGVTIIGDLPDNVRRALSTWSPASAATEAYRERAELALPPARRVITIHGDAQAVSAALAPLDARADVTVVPIPDGAHVLASRGAAQSIVDDLRTLQQESSKAGSGELRLRVDGPLTMPQ